MDETIIRALVDLRDRTLQKSRIAFSNRLSAIEAGRDETDTKTHEMLSRWMERFDELEKIATHDIELASKGIDIIEHLTDLKGISYTLAAKVVSMIDIQRADTVSSLWKYAGYGVNGDGKRDKPVKGEKLVYNKRLKTACYLVGSSFLKCNSPYRALYDKQKEYYELNRLDWTKNHRHLAAMGYMIKFFLSHLWEHWRLLEGLPIRPLYVIEKMGHSTYSEPNDYGWRKLD